jgi:CheY-like chemotaxis protein
MTFTRSPIAPDRMGIPMLKSEDYSPFLHEEQRPSVRTDSQQSDQSSIPKQYILAVDDDLSVRKTMALVLASEGYEVSTAGNGIDALFQLRSRVPHLLICELEMPLMPGLELISIVRRRFPTMAIIAVSGIYEHDDVPPGLVDGFYNKGVNKPQMLFTIVVDAIRASALRAAGQRTLTPVWATKIEKDANGTPRALLNCPECFRSFPVIEPQPGPALMHTVCVFCQSEIRYMVGSHLSFAPSRNAFNNVTYINAGLAGFGEKARAAGKGK